MLVIDPDRCIDCGVCESECPVRAIRSDVDASAVEWLPINRQYAAIWPVIERDIEAPHDADQWANVSQKRQYLDPSPAVRT
jgi:ferredoxin